jgi:hypothetical protein
MAIAKKILMIEPVGFASNPHTAIDNHFQQLISDGETEEKAKKEFHHLREQLENAGIEVIVFLPRDNISTPDAVFPNNWFSTHEDKLVLYPMKAENRRKERREEIIKILVDRYPQVIDLTKKENEEIFLEGTGSIVIDDINQTAFASLSGRTDKNLFIEWCKLTGYKPLVFRSTDRDGKEIYHTNVLITIGDKFAIVCLDAIKDSLEKKSVEDALLKNRITLIKISIEQLHCFCGNCLLLQNEEGENFLVMSTTAYRAFTNDQIAKIIKYATIIHSELHTIETNGGGSARCMIAELF